MMTIVKVPYVDAKKDRKEHVRYWFFRRNGRWWRLPGDPFSEEFAVEYQRLLKLTDVQAAAVADVPIDKRSYGPGTFGKLVRDYLGCGEYKQLGRRTKAEYKRVLEGLQKRHG